MTVWISRLALDAIHHLAAADPLREVCGILLGQGDRIETCLPTANVAQDPTRHFEIDPGGLIAAHRDARKGGPAILGYYHSHPSGLIEPSVTDARDAQPDGRVWLIFGSDKVTAWRSGQGGLHGRFVAEPLVLDDDAALASQTGARQ